MEEIEIHDFPRAEGHPTKCLVDAILNRPNKLKRLFLKCGRHGVDPALLVTALNKVEILEVSLFKDEANMLFKLMMQDETSVMSLSLLAFHHLSELEPRYLFGVFHKLKEFNAFQNLLFQNLPPWRDLMATLCETVAAGTNLKILRLQHVDDLSQVSRQSLSRMVTQVEEFELGCEENATLADEIGTIVEAIATTVAGNLKKLSLFAIDLSVVDSGLLAQMATQVEELRLGGGHILAEDQVKAIFQTIAAGPGKLKKISLRCRSTLHRVDAEILASAVNNLECFLNDYPGSLTIHQMKRILSMALETTCLKNLEFWVRGDTSHLDASLITEVEKVIPNVYIETSDFQDLSDSEP